MTKFIEGITVEQLYEVYHIAASVVTKYGDVYIPIFKRLHKEVQKIEEETQIKTLALKIASANIDLDRCE